MAKGDKNTTATKRLANVRLYEDTKLRLQRVVRKKADLEQRAISDMEVADQYILAGVKRDERKLKIV